MPAPLRLSLTTPPAAEPLDLEDARTFLRVDGSGEDDLISNLITLARQDFEALTGRALINQTWTWALDAWPRKAADSGDWSGTRDGPISMFDAPSLTIPKAPLSSITSITTYDTAGTGTLWAASNYQVDTISVPGRVAPANTVWPTATRALNAIVVVFVAGYGASASAVPIDIRHALKAHIARAYERRGDDGDTSAPPELFTRTVQRYKLSWL